MPFSSEANIRALNTIYDATLDPTQWSAALDAIGQAIGGSGAGLISSDGTSDINIQSSASAIDASARDSYNRHYGRLDEVAARLLRSKADTAIGCYDLIGRRDLLGSEFYADWMRRIDLGDGVFVAVRRDLSTTTYLAVCAPLVQETFATPERKRLAEDLASHVRRAIVIQRRISVADGSFLEVACAEQLGHAVAIIGERGKILHHTGSFASVMAEAQLTASGGRLTARMLRDQAGLDRALEAAAGCAGSRAGSTLAIGSTGSPRIVLRILPVGEGLLSRTWPDARALIIAEPPAKRSVSAAWLREAYGLTKAEAAVACLLASEPAGLWSIASQLGVAVSTVKTHLQRAFEKTGTHRQTELVHLMMSAERHHAPRSRPGGHSASKTREGRVRSD